MTTWAARLTGSTAAAIATIAIRGLQAKNVLEELVRFPKISHFELPIDSIRFCLVHSLDKSLAPEHGVLCRTDDDAYELSLHGGVAICQRVLDDLAKLGCRVVLHSDYPRDDCNAIEQAAEAELEKAPTLNVARVLLHQARGGFAVWCRTLYESLLSPTWNESRLSDCLTEIDELIVRGRRFVRLLKPPRLTMGGPPNVGKSSLTNAIVGTNRVLVHHEPGTTRDAVDVPIVIAGWPLIMTDTAGIREAEDEVESQGVAIATNRWHSADLAVLVVDSTVGWTSTHEQLWTKRTEPTWIAWNKVDHPDAQPIPTSLTDRLVQQQAANSLTQPVLPTSVLLADSIDALLGSIGEWLEGQVIDPALPTPFTTGQIHQLVKLQSLLVQDRVAAIEHLVAMQSVERFDG